MNRVNWSAKFWGASRFLNQTPKEPNNFDPKFLLILYAIPEISILYDKCTGLYLVHSTIGCSYSSDPSNFVQLPHSFRKPRQKHVFSIFFTKRYLSMYFIFFSLVFALTDERKNYWSRLFQGAQWTRFNCQTRTIYLIINFNSKMVQFLQQKVFIDHRWQIGLIFEILYICTPKKTRNNWLLQIA